MMHFIGGIDFRRNSLLRFFNICQQNVFDVIRKKSTINSVTDDESLLCYVCFCKINISFHKFV